MASEDAFQVLIASIVAAGWDPVEAALAVSRLADNHFLAEMANADTAAAIAAAKPKD